jgi:excisionase family DNA binding protein
MLRAALPPEAYDDGITVAQAARIIGCDETTVRELVRCRQIDGWKVGKHRKGKAPTGLRVSRSSCFEYRVRWDAGGPVEAVEPARPKRRERVSAAHLEALASLHARRFRC